MAKIKCSICSYQFNIWYAFHSVGSYINLIFGFGSRDRGLPHPDHGLPRRCTTVERGPYKHDQIEFSNRNERDGRTGKYYTILSYLCVVCPPSECNHKRTWILVVLRPGSVDWKVILTWRGSKAWSRRGFFQCEALALHFAWADLCDCYKCSNSTVQFLVVGACVRARPLLYYDNKWKNPIF